MAETTALGAAMAAGSAEGIQVWDLQRESPDSVISDSFQPSISEDGNIPFWNKKAMCFNLIYFLQNGMCGIQSGKWLLNAALAGIKKRRRKCQVRSLISFKKQHANKLENALYKQSWCKSM